MTEGAVAFRPLNVCSSMNTALAAGLFNVPRYFVAASSNGGSSGLQATE